MQRAEMPRESALLMVHLLRPLECQTFLMWHTKSYPLFRARDVPQSGRDRPLSAKMKKMNRVAMRTGKLSLVHGQKAVVEAVEAVAHLVPSQKRMVMVAKDHTTRAG